MALKFTIKMQENLRALYCVIFANINMIEVIIPPKTENYCQK